LTVFFQNNDSSKRFFDKLTDAIIVIDQLGVIRSYNQSAQVLFGYSVDEVIGKNITMLMPEKERGAHDGYLNARNSGAVDHVVGRIRSIEALKKDGTTFPAHIAISEFETHDGKRFVGFVHDLSAILHQQKQTEIENERLRIQHRVERAVQSAPTPEALLRETLLTLVSMSELELQAKTGVFLVDGRSSSGSRSTDEPAIAMGDPKGLRLAMLEGPFSQEFIEHEAWIPYGACLCGRAAESGSVIMSTDCFSDCRHEHRFTGMTAHGHYIIPLTGQRGVLGVIFLYTDVQPRWDASLKQLLSRLGIMVGGALERLWAKKNSENLLEKLNLALMGSRSALVKVDFARKEMVPVSGHLEAPHLKVTSLRERMQCIPTEYHEVLNLARRNCELVTVPFDLISRRYWFEVQYTHETSENGQRVQYCLLRDVTEQKETQHARDKLLFEVSERRAQQERLYSVIGHEMKTPASALSMLIDSGPPSMLFEDMRLAMDNLLTVMGDMRMLTNPNVEIELLLKPCNPQRLMSQIKDQLAVLYGKQNIELVMDSNLPTSLEVLCDVPRINMLLSNLLRNAALHSDGTRVRLRQQLVAAQIESDCVKITWTIEDDGRGIEQSQLDRLFKPFERGDSKSEGTGLGLYIVNLICEAIDAQIDYQRSETGGACFTVTAILKLNESTHHVAHTVANPESFDGHGRRVLLVEDDRTISMLSKKLLADLNFVVTTAEDGIKGLNAVGSTTFDLILTDYYMPYMNGDELISAIQAENLNVPIIGVSASEDDEEHAKLLEVGADDVIAKPLTKAKIINALADSEFWEDKGPVDQRRLG